jgi:hypothetical protein
VALWFSFRSWLVGEQVPGGPCVFGLVVCRNQRGELDLHLPLADPSLLGPAYAAKGKGAITPLNLLLHNAGYPPDPVPNYNLVEVSVCVCTCVCVLGHECICLGFALVCWCACMPVCLCVSTNPVQFGCPNSNLTHPPEDFSCVDLVYPR